MNSLEQNLRALIFTAAAQHPMIGPLEESIKWGEPSFTPARRNIGSSVRIQSRKNGTVALMFICTTGLVERFAENYPGVFTIEGKRALVFANNQPIPEQETKHVIAMALTFKLKPAAIA